MNVQNTIVVNSNLGGVTWERTAEGLYYKYQWGADTVRKKCDAIADIIETSALITFVIPAGGADSTRTFDCSQYINNGMLIVAAVKEFRVDYADEIIGFKIISIDGNSVTVRFKSNDWGNTARFRFSFWYLP